MVKKVQTFQDCLKLHLIYFFQFFNLFELGADLKLTVPRLLVPFNRKELVPSIMSPKTEIILGTTLQKNIGLDKQFFTGTYQFDWKPKNEKKIQFKWIELEFVNNRNLYSSEENISKVPDISEPPSPLISTDTVAMLKLSSILLNVDASPSLVPSVSVAAKNPTSKSPSCIVHSEPILSNL